MDKKVICPLNGKKCIEDGAIVDGELVACRFWIHVLGKNPQTGEDLNAGDCAFAWMPVLLIENTKEQRTTSKEVETLRNEIMPQAAGTNGILSQLLGSVKPMPRIGNDNGQDQLN